MTPRLLFKTALNDAHIALNQAERAEMKSAGPALLAAIATLENAYGIMVEAAQNAEVVELSETVTA